MAGLKHNRAWCGVRRPGGGSYSRIEKGVTKSVLQHFANGPQVVCKRSKSHV